MGSGEGFESVPIEKPTISPEGGEWLVKASMAAKIFEGVGHDMRNLLTPVYGLDGLKEETRDRINLGLDRLALASLLCNPKIPFDFKRTNWSAVFALQDCSGNLMVKGDAPLVADLEVLSGAVAELIKNSLEAGGKNIIVSVKEDEDGSLVEIVDDGSGLLVEQNSLFGFSNPSGKRNKDGAVKGLSLGLFMANTIVVRHGGKLLVENRNDGQKGTRAVIRLPAV